MPKSKKQSSNNIRKHLTEQNLLIVLAIVLLISVGVLLTKTVSKPELAKPTTVEPTSNAADL